MNPQQGNNANGVNPQQGNNGTMSGFGPNISYENFSDEAIKAASRAEASTSNGVPINVVNANGIVSGRKMVDEEWRKIAICAGILAAGCLIGVVIVLFLMHFKISDLNKVQDELVKNKAGSSAIYSALGATNRDEALALINNQDMLTGADMAKINKILIDKYGANYVVDFADDTINQVRRGNLYTTVSLGVAQEEGTVRAIIYAKNANGEWKMAEFDKMAEDSCADSSDEDKLVLKTIGLCLPKDEAEQKAYSEVEEEKDEAKPTKKPAEKPVEKTKGE